MNNYKVTFSTGKNEHILEIAADNKEQAEIIAQNTIGHAGDIISLVHIPEPYPLF